jgi:hypothetical protein
MPKLDLDEPDQVLLVHWSADSWARYSRRIIDQERVPSLWVRAVPASERHAVAEQLPDQLTALCRWAAEAPHRGNVWTASEHSRAVRWHDGKLIVQEQ